MYGMKLRVLNPADLFRMKLNDRWFRFLLLYTRYWNRIIFIIRRENIETKKLIDRVRRILTINKSRVKEILFIERNEDKTKYQSKQRQYPPLSIPHTCIKLIPNRIKWPSKKLEDYEIPIKYSRLYFPSPQPWSSH